MRQEELKKEMEKVELAKKKLEEEKIKFEEEKRLQEENERERKRQEKERRIKEELEKEKEKIILEKKNLEEKQKLLEEAKKQLEEEKIKHEQEKAEEEKKFELKLKEYKDKEKEALIDEELHSDDEIVFLPKIKQNKKIVNDYISEVKEKIPKISLSLIEYNKIKIINEADLYSYNRRKEQRGNADENSNLKKIIDKNERTIEEKELIIESIKKKSSSMLNTNNNTIKNSFELNDTDNPPSSLIFQQQNQNIKYTQNNSNLVI